MFEDRVKIGQDLLDVPMGEMIKDMAMSIAEAQLQLDKNSMDIAEMMGGLYFNDETGMYEDDRVAFGQQQLTISEALQLYGNTTDTSLKSDIKNELVPKTGSSLEELVTHDPETDSFTISEGVTGNKSITIPQRLSMMELGFTPTFYQFVDTIIEVKINIRYTAEQSTSSSSSSEKTNTIKTKNKSGWFFKKKKKKEKTVTTSQVNANFSQKFSYSAEGSSLLRTKLVPVPPPAVLQERIRQQMEIARSTEKVQSNNNPTGNT